MVEEFKIDFQAKDLDELKERIDKVRFPNFACEGDWTLGTPTLSLEYLLNLWRDYDWIPQEDYLNSWPQYLSTIDGVRLHYFHIKAKQKDAPTILMAHGWPDCFLRYTKTFPLLKDFNLVVPSICGFGFATLPAKGWSSNAETADFWHTLMTEVLGYKEYIATGGDMGRGVLMYLASKYPKEVKGLHLTDVGVAQSIMTSPEDSLSAEWLAYRKEMQEWMKKDGGYISIQGSKPYSLGYGLVDSPAGLAGWLMEKYHDWSDWERFNIDDLLNNLTVYWMTRCGASSITNYYGNSTSLPPLGKVNQPIAICRFPKDILPVPCDWIKDNYNVVQFSEMPYGGHFTAMEAPEPFSEDLKKFVSLIV